MNQDQLKIIYEILARHELNFILFGSRVDGGFRKDSDLDICLKYQDGCSINLEVMEQIRKDFSDSSLPFMVDIVDYHDLDLNFKKIIDAKKLTTTGSKLY